MFFGGTAAAASIGLINALGTLGGFAGPYMIGSNAGANGHFSRGLYLVGTTLLASAAMILILRAVQKKTSKYQTSERAR